MKRVFLSLPESEQVVVREVARLARELNLRPPESVEFWYKGDGQYLSETKTIHLPSPEFVSEFDPDLCTEPDRYWGVVIHELSHYVADMWHGEEGHTPRMFAIAMGIVLREGLPLDDFYLWENNYKPRSFKRGRKVAGQVILDAMRKANRVRTKT